MRPEGADAAGTSMRHTDYTDQKLKMPSVRKCCSELDQLQPLLHLHPSPGHRLEGTGIEGVGQPNIAGGDGYRQ